ncbi:putative F-box protein [Cardamine amara subsp. amara]|uniref:F-box protein n=1 Tax=Cardamine amara subsp. amara TaxID=228776 RepID=A0ABD0ZE20_CARAN
MKILLINNDVLEEIMLKLPVRSLGRFQIVSKHWRCTIKSRSFMERHMLHEKTLEPKILCLYKGENSCDGNNIITLTTLRLDWSCSTTCLAEEVLVPLIGPQSKEKIRGCSSWDGFLCIFDIEILTTPILVTNPATGQSQILSLSLIQQQYLDSSHTKMPLP